LDTGAAPIESSSPESEPIEGAPAAFGETIDDRLVQMRLGIAAGLFTALQCKSPAVASHSLRVALTCSAWALKMDLPEPERDALEVAALLHDVGLIGVPDHILQKPAVLDGDEIAAIGRSRAMSLDILRHGGASPQVLEIVAYVSAWYDGSQWSAPLRGQEIPLPSRMIAIVEAFDAMTTAHVYRPARSQERAMAELFACGDRQFDLELIGRFADFRQEDQSAIRAEVARRWLRSLEPDLVDSHWELNAIAAPKIDCAIGTLFQDRLLESMYDAVVFVDAAGRVALWNRGTERLTGIGGTSVRGEMWHPELLGLSDEQGRLVSEIDCPVHTAIRCGVQSLRRLTILGRGRQPIAVDTHAIPVINEQGVSEGTILLLHDASSETSLEERCQSLYEKATKDPLTQVSNRAEFDRVHAMVVATHQQQQVPCSLLMCDLDCFKRVNDTYGHQAGDDVIKCLASLLKSNCRPGDLVARYGGEEFVLLCADCDNASAARRAESIRNSLSHVSQPKMDGRTATVSFGVTEIQPGDTPETMLRRADRALLMAKENGRNRVVQLGSGKRDELGEPGAVSWLFPSARPQQLLRKTLVTPVPLQIAIEKLRGFVADHEAKIVLLEGSQVRLEIEDKSLSRLRRLADRSSSFQVDLLFEEERPREKGDDDVSATRDTTRTKIRIAISSRRQRDRRREEVMARAGDLMASFRAYLMANEEGLPTSPGTLTRVKRILSPWRGLRRFPRT
jgi:diguanylate cyclase (GGDEF)-like protein